MNGGLCSDARIRKRMDHEMAVSTHFQLVCLGQMRTDDKNLHKFADELCITKVSETAVYDTMSQQVYMCNNGEEVR